MADSLLVVLRFSCPGIEAVAVLSRAPSTSSAGSSSPPRSSKRARLAARPAASRVVRSEVPSSSKATAHASGRSGAPPARTDRPSRSRCSAAATAASVARPCCSSFLAVCSAFACTAPPRSAWPSRSGVSRSRRRPRSDGAWARRRSSATAPSAAGPRCADGRAMSRSDVCWLKPPTQARPRRFARARRAPRHRSRRARIRRPGRCRSSTAPSSAPRTRREGLYPFGARIVAPT